MDEGHEGRVAVVTGGAGGIGRATALELARQGAAVVVADLDDAGAQETVAQVEALGRAASFVRTDVSSADELEALMTACVQAHGRLDVMFNNAGVASGAPLLEWTPEQYRKVVAVNQDGVFFGMQAAARAMRELGRGGVIINTGSVYGRLATCFASAYQATKAAVEVLTRVAALELAPLGIRVVNVAPGVVDTSMTDDYRRMGVIDAMARKHMGGALVQPEQVARVVALVASDAAAAINGTTVYADDGYSAFK